MVQKYLRFAKTNSSWCVDEHVLKETWMTRQKYSALIASAQLTDKILATFHRFVLTNLVIFNWFCCGYFLLLYFVKVSYFWLFSRVNIAFTIVSELATLTATWSSYVWFASVNNIRKWSQSLDVDKQNRLDVFFFRAFSLPQYPQAPER